MQFSNKTQNINNKMKINFRLIATKFSKKKLKIKKKIYKQIIIF